MQHQSPETNSVQNVLGIVADDVCCQPKSRLPRDFVNQRVELEAAIVPRLYLEYNDSVCLFLVL